MDLNFTIWRTKKNWSTHESRKFLLSSDAISKKSCHVGITYLGTCALSIIWQNVLTPLAFTFYTTYSFVFRPWNVHLFKKCPRSFRCWRTQQQQFRISSCFAILDGQKSVSNNFTMADGEYLKKFYINNNHTVRARTISSIQQVRNQFCVSNLSIHLMYYIISVQWSEILCFCRISELQRCILDKGVIFHLI